MKRTMWITGAFVVIELLLDVVVHFTRLHYGPSLGIRFVLDKSHASA